MYWITSNLVTLIQNYLIYNHGPGKKVPVAPDKEKAGAQAQPSSEKAGAFRKDGDRSKGTQVKNRQRAVGRGRRR